jgi:uncharacterized repeat protein (TIGR03803 family)
MRDRFVSVLGRIAGFGGGWALLFVAGLLTVAEVRGQFTVSTVNSLGVPDLVGAQSSATLFLGTDGVFYGTTYSGGGGILGTVFKLSPGANQLQVLHRFMGMNVDGAVVSGGVLVAANGVVYGTTGEGGLSNLGTIFCVNRDGANYRLLHSFTGNAGDGRQPFAGLSEGSNGMLYGMTRYGGTADKGTVFRLRPDGTDYGVLHSFSGTPAGGAEPVARLLEGPDGRWYGTTVGVTSGGGVTNQGTVFALNSDGTGHEVLRQFTGEGGDGATPYGDLTVGQDGWLYGSTVGGGNARQGTLFRLHLDGSGYEQLHSFDLSAGDGATPYGPLLESAPGTFHGVASSGGPGDGRGVIFTLQADGSDYRILHTFEGGTADGGVPYGGLAKGPDGALYGTTWIGGLADIGVIYRIEMDGSGYEVLEHFSGGGGDPVTPYAGLMRGSDGVLYGTSWAGGNRVRGTVYRVAPGTGDVEVLHHFVGGADDGETPYGGVIEGSDGILYGTAVQGGAANLGVIFKLNKDGSGFGIVRSFQATSGGGYYPYGTLIEGSDGVLYGTTLLGGGGNYGIVFKINRNGGSYSVLRNFQGGNDGAYPYAGVVEASDGLLYGVTASGGGTADRGTVFRIRRGGGDYTVLRRFSGSEDGRQPFARLLVGSDGLLYGTTGNGGRSGSGTAFRLARNGSDYRLLYQFDGSSAQGISVLGGLTEGPGDMLYGTTEMGGQWGRGTLFRLDREGTALEVVHHFGGAQGDGGNPAGELVEKDGILYGTSRTGGIGCGTVYRLAPSVNLALGSDGMVSVTAPTGFVYRIESSVEVGSLALWQTLTQLTMTNSPAQVALPDYGVSSKQFIRAVVGP